MATQVTLNSGAVASAGALALQTNGTTEAVSISTGQVATLAQNPILTSGTANGVAYLNGSKAVTSGSGLVFDGTNLGVGVTPSAWNSNRKVVQINRASLVGTDGNETNLGSNYYWDGSANRYIASTNATLYNQGAGAHIWYTSASGTAGNAITFTQAMTLDASGNFGVGTTSPAYPLDVVGASSGGWTLNMRGRSSDNIGYMRFSSNNGTTTYAAIGTPAANTLAIEVNGSERARIDSSGNLLVGATSGSGLGSSKIYVLTNNQNGIISQQAVTGSYCYLSNALSNGGIYYHFQFNENGTQRGLISSNGSSTTYGTSSDYRLKENIAPMTGALSTVAQLKPCTYTWKESGITSQGFIAHELQAVVPDAVVGEKDAVNEDGSIKPQSIDTSFLVATLTAAIKEQQAIINQLTARITALESA